MRKKNGFTLIELLAVIIILALIALIVTPLIMNVINDAKEGSAQDNAHSYIKAVELAISDNMEENLLLTNGNYMVKDGNLYTENGISKVLDVLFKGTKPENGGIVTFIDGNVEGASLTFNGISVTIGESNSNITTNYAIGNKVKVKGLTGTFHVMQNLGEADGRVLLLYDASVASGAYHTIESNEFSGSLAEKLLKENTATWQTSIASAGGNTTGMAISIPSLGELQIVRSYYGFTDDRVADNIAWLTMDNYFFTKTPSTTAGKIMVYTTGHALFDIGPAHNYGSYIRPTLLIHKSNVTKVA